MSYLPETTEQRLRALTAQQPYADDAWYHAVVERFRAWLIATELALEDEGVTSATAERILNRLVYATPTGAEAHERQAQLAAFERLATCLPI